MNGKALSILHGSIMKTTGIGTIVHLSITARCVSAMLLIAMPFLAHALLWTLDGGALCDSGRIYLAEYWIFSYSVTSQYICVKYMARSGEYATVVKIIPSNGQIDARATDYEVREAIQSRVFH